jgi:hypothetical protein
VNYGQTQRLDSPKQKLHQTSVGSGPEEELASVVLTPPRELGRSGRRTLLRQAVPAPSPRLNLVTPPDHHHLALHAMLRKKPLPAAREP